jgi:hypothetical protein
MLSPNTLSSLYGVLRRVSERTINSHRRHRRPQAQQAAASQQVRRARRQPEARLGRPPIAVQVQVRDTAPPFFPAHPLVTPATMASAEPKKRIAGILTWYTVGSHSDVLVGKFLPGRGIPADDGFHELRTEMVSMWIDQTPDGKGDIETLPEEKGDGSGGDIGLALAEAHGVPVYSSIREALCCGGEALAVDGVILIGEHGDYPWNEKGQHMFPRKYFMEQICGVFASSGRSCPVFNDKHLSYNFHDAKWMYDKAIELKVPFMAGSSLVNCYRNPPLEHPLEAPIKEAIAVGYSGLDIYAAHTLEVLQVRTSVLPPPHSIGRLCASATPLLHERPCLCCSAWWSAGRAARAASWR